MANEHSPSDDICYDLISVQYHALKGAEVYDRYIDDAHDHQDVAEFFREVKEEDARRAERCHQLLKDLTS